MSHSNPLQTPTPIDEDDDLLDAEDADEEIPDDPDHPMDLDDEDAEAEEEISLQNDSLAHFDGHSSSVFCIAAHPIHPSVVVTGGGDDVAYIFDTSIPTPEGSLLPREWENNPDANGGARGAERKSIIPHVKLDGHTDSVNGVTFTLPQAQYVVTAGLDGKLRAWLVNKQGTRVKLIGEASEVKEINWVTACPNPGQENVVALGASDGSVWVYRIDAADKASPLTIVQAFYLHTESCTAGAWSADGTLLATVSEDGSFYVWEVFGSGSAVVSLTAEDQRFQVEGGLYSVAISPNGTMAAVGGAGGNIKIVGLPHSTATTGAETASTTTKKPKPSATTKQAATSSSAGQILASLQAQTDGIETLSFSSPPLTILAAGSVDGSIALFDTAHRFALRRHIKEAHEEFAVVKVDFVRDDPQKAHILTSAGMDGVVRRWDVRGGTTAAGQGFLREWRGHRGDGEGGGVLGFVQYGERIVTAGDDSIALVFGDKSP